MCDRGWEQWAAPHLLGELAFTRAFLLRQKLQSFLFSLDSGPGRFLVRCSVVFIISEVLLLCVLSIRTVGPVGFTADLSSQCGWTVLVYKRAAS